MLPTQVLSEDIPENIEKENDDDVEVVGYIVVKDCSYEIKKGETKIGRDPTMCSIVIENLTISKVHAFIESDGIDETFIYDAGSTNFTKLGKKTLRPHCRYKLENDSDITFGNITAKFILLPKISQNSESKSNLENFKATKKLEDIFDAVTQATVPHPHTSGEILQFENESKNIQIIKIPDLVDSGEKSRESLKSSKDFVKVTECQLNSQDLVSRTEFYSGSPDPSSIFSLSTQCQIIQPSSKEIKLEDKISNDGNKNNKADSVKSFFDDDEDSVLCAFMSLHSPSGKTVSESSKEIKTKSVQEHCTELFEAQTEVQTLLSHSSSKKSKSTLQFNEDLNIKGSSKPSNCSSQLENGSKINRTNISEDVSNSTKDPEEDFLKTQEFILSNSALEKCGSTLLSGPVHDNILQEPDTKYYSEKTGNLSVAEGLSDNEDLICTQKFEILCKNKTETTNNLSENEEVNDSSQDFMETQMYNFEREQSNQVTTGKSPEAAIVVSESPEKDSEPHMEVCNDFTQRNIEEDFIDTQAFREMTQDKKNTKLRNSGSSGRNDDDYIDDEDFIATQPVDLLLKFTAKEICSQTPISIQDACRERSPDLLDSGFCTKTSKDFINKKPEDSFSEFSDKVNSGLIINAKKELNEDFNRLRERSLERIESSGDETESDLEIIFDKSEISKKITRNEELGDKCSNVESQQSEKDTITGTSKARENNHSNSSYIFHLDPESPVEVPPNPTSTERNIVDGNGKPTASDSDATDCEDITAGDREMPIEQELSEKISFAITSSSHYEVPSSPPQIPAHVTPEDGPIDNKESPSFEIGKENECWSQLSLEMPDTQDMRNAEDEILCKSSSAALPDQDPKKEGDYETPSKISKTEVNISGSNSVQNKAERQNDSLLKRPGNSGIEIEAVPIKKSKIEASDGKLRSSDKQLLKLWQVHSFAQIQPSRTRNSLKNGEPANNLNKTNISLGDNISNKFATSRRETSAKKNTRKLSFDITPYLCKKVESDKSTFLEGRKKITPPKENRAQSKPVECCHRVLRSSTRSSSGHLPPRQVLTRSTRNSRFREENLNVVFTGFDSESLEEVIFDLGGKKTSDMSSGDVVVADKIRRTVKFLSAIALGLPVTSPQWLLACKEEKRFLNPWNFILKDDESERKWGFELKASLERSKKVKLMQGLSVFATANAKPPVKDLMAIVKYCGGTPLLQPLDVWPKKTVIVSCAEDKKCWPLPKFRNVRIVHYEFVLTGVLRQKLDFKTYKLR